jgi:hypothetical protein
MKLLGAALGVVASTLLLLVLLLWANPFERANDALDYAFGAAPKWTQVETLLTDPTTQETSRGEHPGPSLQSLAAYWGSHGGAKRVVFMGNSQMQTMSLAPGETAPGATELTYFDQVADFYREHSGNVLCYRLSAPGMSYTETLWYLEYLLQNAALRPDAVVLQINYQAFWNGGIRHGALEMLGTPAFRARIETLARSGQPYAEFFDEALKNYAQQRRGTTTVGAASTAQGPGYGWETEAREQLEKTGLLEKSRAAKASFEQMLYRARLYILRLQPSSARSISGPRLLRSQAAIEAIAERCRLAHVKLVLFTAPLNPRISLYRNAEDKATYETFVQNVATKYNLPLYRFDDCVLAEYWGRLLNGPDPLHLGRRGHQIVAAKMIEIVRKTLPGE